MSFERGGGNTSPSEVTFNILLPLWLPKAVKHPLIISVPNYTTHYLLTMEPSAVKAAEALGGPTLALPQPWMPLPVARLLPAHPARDQKLTTLNVIQPLSGLFLPLFLANHIPEVLEVQLKATVTVQRCCTAHVARSLLLIQCQLCNI